MKLFLIDHQTIDIRGYSREIIVFRYAFLRPKDVLDGTMKGVGNILTGALSGAAMMVTAPVAGAYQGAQTGGAFGAVKGLGVGLGLGVVGGAALIVGGTATGLYQMGRGVYNTPEAFGAATKGYEWDDSKKKWILYKLQEEAAILEQSEEDFLKENAPQGTSLCRYHRVTRIMEMKGLMSDSYCIKYAREYTT